MTQPTATLEPQLRALRLPFIRDNYQDLARHAIAGRIFPSRYSFWSGR